MRALIPVLLTVSTFAQACAQTQPTRPSAYATGSTRLSAFPTSALNPCRSSINPTSPCYSGTWFSVYSATEAQLPIVAPRKPSLLGADRIDQTEATLRLKDKGYLNVSQLERDKRGIWRGKASLKDGRSVEVVLDLDGNIYSQPKR